MSDLVQFQIFKISSGVYRARAVLFGCDTASPCLPSVHASLELTCVCAKVRIPFLQSPAQIRRCLQGGPMTPLFSNCHGENPRHTVLHTPPDLPDRTLIVDSDRTWLHRQNRLLRSTIKRMTQCGLVVGLHWVSTGFQPADPPSRLDAVVSSSPLPALYLAQLRWHMVCARVPGPEAIGVVWL